MLVGQYCATLTDKGRIPVPSKFRHELGEKVVVAKWYEGCLVVVSESEWTRILDRLTGKTSTITQPVRDTDRFILGSAFEVSLDSLGRFVVPKVLKEFADLKQEVVFLGLGNRLEVWGKKLWEERETYIQKHAGEMLEKLANEAGGERQ